MAKVSIITPVYNVEACIERCIKSIINQTCSDFELLLIDDGSQDKSIEIAKGLLEKTELNYRIITQKNAGVSAARNRGIREATGQYITFLDSDDYFENTFIEKMYNKAKETSCEIVFCDYSEVDENGNVLVKNRTKYLDSPIRGEDAALRQLKDEITIGMRSAIYKSNLIKSHNLTFDSTRKYGEDMIFVVKALLFANRVVSVNEILAYYVIWGNSVTQNVSLKHIDCYNSYIDLLDYVKIDEKYEPIRKFLVEFKIPYSIAHIFSVFTKDENFHEELMNFIERDDIKKALKKYKMQKLNLYNLRFLIQSKGMRRCPEFMMKVFGRLRK